MGAGAVISYYAADMKQVFAQAAEQNGGKVHLIWLTLASETGCTVSMLQASNPNLIEAIENLSISADFWKTLMTPDYDLGWVSAGYTREDLAEVPLYNAAFGDAPVDVLVVEGAPQLGTPTGGIPGGFCAMGEYNGASVTGFEVMQKLAAKASYVVAVGQCSSFGGIPAAKGSLTGAVSVTDALKSAGVETKKPVVNIPGCPANPDWTIATLATLLQGFDPDLDELGRPKAFFSHYIHDTCPRRGYYDNGQFASKFDDPECLWNLGCKGPITQSSCAITKWNNGVGFCTEAGPMCWGCMHPNFPDPPVSPFFQEVPGFPGINIPTLEVAGAATAVVGTALAIGTALKSKKGDSEKGEGGAKKA